MRIAYLAAERFPCRKGAGVRIAMTLRALQRLGHRVEALFFASDEGAQDPDLAGATVAKVAPQGASYLERMLHFRRTAETWLARRRVDAVFFRGIFEGAPALEFAHRTGARAVFEAHGLPSVELPAHRPGLYRRPATLERLVADEQYLLHGADLVLTHSRTGARYLLSRGVAPERIATVRNAADPELFAPPPAPPDDAVPLRIVYTGTLAPWQGLETLLVAMAACGRGAFELHLVGPTKSAWRRRLRALARSLRVHRYLYFAGSVEHESLAPVLHSAHLCAAPLAADARNLLQGCCPLKVLEYMACGRPIIATGVPPILEILEHGRTAHLCAPGDALAMAHGLAWMRDHPDEREAMARRAREQILAAWTPAHFERSLEAALTRL